MTHRTLSLFMILGHLEINWLQNNGYPQYWQCHKVRFSYINSFVIFWKQYRSKFKCMMKREEKKLKESHFLFKLFLYISCKFCSMSQGKMSQGKIF